MKIALVENFGADFVGARLRFAIFLKNNGIKVTAIIPNDGHKKIIEDEGIRTIEVGANIRGKGFVNKLDFAVKLKKILKEENFDIVHYYRLQPNIIGTLVSGLFTKSKIVNHVTGLGVVFTSNQFKNKVLQYLIKGMYKFNNFFFKPYTIYQNKQDIKDLGVKKRSTCIVGSAVNEDKFNILNLNKESQKELKQKLGINKYNEVFIFVSRLLKEKGVLELVESFKNVVKNKNKNICLLLVGWSDAENPSAVTPNTLSKLIKEYPFIKFLGKRSDVNELIGISSVSILPTYYREGTPRFLLESMRLNKPIITTDVPGCDHLIPENKNGLLIPSKNAIEIEKAIIKILNLDLLELGKESFKLYDENFSEKIVYNSILNLYKLM